MECRKIREMLTAYLEGFVSSEERILIEKHIPSCHGCSNVLKDLKRAGELVKGLEEVEPPPWMKQRVMAQVRAEEEARESIFRRLLYPLHIKVPIEAFATVLIAVIAIYVFRAVEPEIKKDHGPSATQQVVAEGEASKEAPVKESPPGGSLLQEASPQMAPPKEPQKGMADSPAPGGETLALRGAQSERIRKRADSPAPGRETPAEESLRPGGGEGVGAQRVREEERERKEVASRQKDERAAGSAMKRDMERKASPAPPPRLRAFGPKRTEAIGVTLHARNVGIAIGEIENLLVRLGANRIEREYAEGAEVITAELQAEKLKDLLEKMKTVGEVKEKDAITDIAKGDTAIRIEIIGNP